MVGEDEKRIGRTLLDIPPDGVGKYQVLIGVLQPFPHSPGHGKTGNSGLRRQHGYLMAPGLHSFRQHSGEARHTLMTKEGGVGKENNVQNVAFGAVLVRIRRQGGRVG